jgi:hypothetical protein
MVMGKRDRTDETAAGQIKNAAIFIAAFADEPDFSQPMKTNP